MKDGRRNHHEEVCWCAGVLVCCVKHGGGLCQLAGFHPQAAMVLEEIIQVDEAQKYEAASLCTANSGGRKKLLPAAVIALALKACLCVQLLLPMECFVSDQAGFHTTSFLRINGKSPATNHCTLNSTSA